MLFNLKRDEWNWAHNFMLTQFIFQLLLLVPGIGAARTAVRVGSFGLSLYLLMTRDEGKIEYPVKFPGYAILLVLFLSLCFSFNLNSIPAGVGQIAMYLAILGPLFWAGKLPLSDRGFRNLLMILWGFQAISSLFGLLQIYFPTQFQFQISSVYDNNPNLEGLKIVLENGVSLYRPSGLTDQPGGAALAGFYTVLFGLAFFLEGKSKYLSKIGLASTFIGFFCIYMSQIRNVLIATCLCISCLLIVLAITRNFKRAMTLVGTIQPMVLGTFGWAIAVGGTKTLDRITSLFAGSAEDVYRQNRGHFLEDTINILLPKYPLGAGLGRWGMMNAYFGKNGNPLTDQIWVEIQWTGWLLDGGVPLIIAYSGALILASYLTLKIAFERQRRDELSFWGAVIFSYNIGIIMITFNYPVFISQMGMEFWLLNAALFVAANRMSKLQEVTMLLNSR
jgi:hypothetical protein